MAIDELRRDETTAEAHVDIADPRLSKARRRGFGVGLLKGLAVTLKHLFKRNTVIEYPDEKQDLPSRTRGVIALKEENCTVCMLCARECPDWCIYIDSHKETLPPKRAGGRQRKRNVLDRFAIDYALCMYCGICVEVCPYDALFWSREFEYAEYDIRELTHEKEKLSDWMATVLPPPELEAGAGEAEAGAPAAAKTTTAATGARPATPTTSAVTERPAQAAAAPAEGTAAPTAARPKESEPEVDTARAEGAAEQPAASATPAAPAKEDTRKETSHAPEGGAVTAPGGAVPPTEEREGEVAEDIEAEAAKEAPAPAAEDKPGRLPDEAAPAETPPTPESAKAPEVPAPLQAGEGPTIAQVEVPHEAPQPVTLEPEEDPDAVYRAVLKEQLDKGSSPQVAEARAKVARVTAERGVPRAPTPVEVEKPVPSAPTKAEQAARKKTDDEDGEH
jgi:formate hydrogenlyase subunit 6/NADH:ubiquinone oxidoreductase subunit I